MRQRRSAGRSCCSAGWMTQRSAARFWATRGYGMARRGRSERSRGRRRDPARPSGRGEERMLLPGKASTFLPFLLLAACAAGTPHPVTGTPTTGVRLIIGGDSRDDAAHVLPWAFSEAKARAAAAFIFLGDMELTPQLDEHFRSELPLLDPIPFYPALGNHEVKVFGFLAVEHARAEK